MRSPFGGGAFQSGGIADPEADDGGGGDDDSGGGGGGGGTDFGEELGAGQRTSGGGGGGGGSGGSVGSVTRDRGGAGAGGGGEPSAGLGSGDDSGGGSVGPSRQGRDDRQATSPNIEGGDQRLFNEAAEQQRDRAESAAQSGGDQRLRNQATPNIEGGDQRLFTEAAEQQREAGADEQFGDIPVGNPVTGNRVEADLQGLSDRFQSGADDAFRSVSARPDRPGVSTVRETLIDTADPFGLALAGKEGVEFAADAVERVPESESRAAFVEDVQERTGTIARGTAERARSSPGEFGLEVATGFIGGTAAASGARRAAGAARVPDVNVGLEQRQLETFLDDDRGMANFPEQRTITRTAEGDLDRLAAEVDEMSLRDRARQRLPPREEFESDAAFQRELDALEQRLIQRELDELAEDTDTDTATQQVDSGLDSRQTQQTASTQRPGRGRQREAESMADRDLDDLGDQRMDSGQQRGRGRQRAADTTADRDLDGILTDVAAGTAAASGTQLDAEATQLAGQQTDLGAVVDLQQGTQVAEGIQTQLADDLTTTTTADTLADQQTTTQTTTQTGTQTTTTTGATTTGTTTTGTPNSPGDRGRPRPDLPEFDGFVADDDERRSDDRLGDTGVVNPVRSLAEVDDNLVDDLDTVGGQDAP